MIEGYAWVHWTLLTIGILGLCYCADRVLDKWARKKMDELDD